MNGVIVKLTHEGVAYYLEWSSISDQPNDRGRPLAEFKAYYRRAYGEVGYAGRGMTEGLAERLARVENHGTSSMDETLTADALIAFNRAGPEEACLTPAELIAAYCLGQPVRDGWLPRCARGPRA